MNISLRQIKAFLEVARLGNFTRAAEKLHVTQAGLSIMMRELETQLDCRLFDRTTRLVALTPAGDRFLPVARQMVDSLEQAAAQLGEMATEARQTLRVGVTPLVASSVMPEAYLRFCRKHPQVKVRLVDGSPYQVQGMVESGDVDLGLGAFFKSEPGVEMRPLLKYRLMCISQKPKGKGRAQSQASLGALPWQSLQGKELVGLPPDNRIQQVIETHLDAIGRAHEDRQTFNNFETLIAMVAVGAGSAIVPSYAVAACRRHGVQMSALTEPEVSLDFFRLMRRGRAAAPLADALVETVVEVIESLQLD